jgi:Protein of unknown function (DUF3551)
MRIVIASLAILTLGGALDCAQADPYRWCAQYAGRGSTNCYFVTLAQCQAALSGNGGLCTPNNFYTGDDVPPKRARRRG